MRAVAARSTYCRKELLCRMKTRPASAPAAMITMISETAAIQRRILLRFRRGRVGGIGVVLKMPALVRRITVSDSGPGPDSGCGRHRRELGQLASHSGS